MTFVVRDVVVDIDDVSSASKMSSLDDDVIASNTVILVVVAVLKSDTFIASSGLRIPDHIFQFRISDFRLHFVKIDIKEQ